MKSFDQLTEKGQLRRLRQLVMLALQEYDLQVKRVRFLAIHTNTYFRLDTADGQKYAVRIYTNDSSSAENRAEMYWLTALNRDTDLHVLSPVPRRDGGYITHLTVPNVPGEQRLAIYQWVPGRHLEYYMTPENYYKLGRCMAKLHDHAETLTLPADIQPKKWDKVFYYPNEPVIYHTVAYQHLFPPQRIALLEEAIGCLNPFLSGMYKNGSAPILIHGDLHIWNVHVYRGELYLFDFEDITLGYPAQDVAITLWYGRSRDDYADLRAAYDEGYKSQRPWPIRSEVELQTLIIARTVNFMNYAPRVWDNVEDFLDVSSQQIKTFLRNF